MARVQQACGCFRLRPTVGQESRPGVLQRPSVGMCKEQLLRRLPRENPISDGGQSVDKASYRVCARILLQTESGCRTAAAEVLDHLLLLLNDLAQLRNLLDRILVRRGSVA